MLFSLLHFISSDYVVGITGLPHGGPGFSATSTGNSGRWELPLASPLAFHANFRLSSIMES